ncbi:MAG: hypothetical protein HZC22_14535 [Rhodocyclales bacterium]|nr:hypothetical protein [Rhodocyclales bacterium]
MDRFRVDLGAKSWCNQWHMHFDWEGFGNQGWVHRRRHLNLLLKALGRARRELASAEQPNQLFALIHPHRSGDDAVFVHTANPVGGDFPMSYWNAEAVTYLPPFLAGRVDLKLYSVIKQRHDGEVSFVIEARTTTSTS